MGESGGIIGHFTVGPEGTRPGPDWRDDVEWIDVYKGMFAAPEIGGWIANSVARQLSGGRRTAAFHVYVRAVRSNGDRELSVCDCACPTDDDGVIHAGLTKWREGRQRSCADVTE